MKIRVAAVQPHSASGPRERDNVEAAVHAISTAAALGARLIVFPEGYPGPTNPRNGYDSLEPLGTEARRQSVFVVAGRIEPDGKGRYHVALYLIGPQGETVGVYRRTTPEGPYIYHDIDVWQFDYSPASELPVFETELGTIGMLVCSEVYVPELSRILALQGADIIVYPAGGAINELLPSWRTMVCARAIENLVYTLATQNLYGPEEGVAIIAGPEGTLAMASGEAILTADLDLDRLNYLRQEDERIVFPKPYRTVPGLMRWRRPELYHALQHLAVETKRS